MSLPRFSVHQTVLVNVLFFVLLLAGWSAFQRIPIEFYPDITLNSVRIDTVWLGASAEEVERLVTQKLEEELRSVSDIDEMRSVSQADISEIVIDFDETLGALDYEAALNDVRSALDRVSELPEDAEEPVLFEITLGEVSPVAFVAVVDSGGVGPVALREVARDLRTRLAELPGARRASIRGEQERELRVLIDRDAAARFGLSALEVAERIRRQNLNLPAGTFATAQGESTLRARGDYQSVEELLGTVVREESNGSLVRLAEVAVVEEGLEKARYRSRYNGQPALLVSLTKKSGTDLVGMVERLDAWLESYRPLLPAGVEIHKTVDTAAFVMPRIRTLTDNLLTGVFFVMLILWLTIGFRNSLLTIIAIPFSFLTAMILFPLLDISINSYTLIGMLLVSGMLVDDAIIVLENIYCRIEAGDPLREAVIRGAEEVLWPVVCAVSTTMAAFLPLLLIEGTSGKFAAILPKAVVVCLAASLLECLVILPAHYLDFGSRRASGSARAGPKPAGRLGRLFASLSGARVHTDRGLIWLRDRYAAALDVVLLYRGSFGLLIAAVLFFAFAAAQHLPVELFPGEYDAFNVLLETDADASLEQTDAVVQAYEAEIATLRGAEIVDFSSVTGLSVDSNYDDINGPNVALTWLVMTPSNEQRADPDAIVKRVRDRMQAFRAAHPEGIAELRVMAQQDGPPVGPPVEVRIQGEDWAEDEAVAREMVSWLRGLPGVHGIEHNLKLGPSEVRLVVDAERAARHGLGFEDLARALRAANDGIVASRFRDPARDEDVDIRVMLAAAQRRGLQDLLDVELAAPGGYLLKLRDVAGVELTRGHRAYRHYDAKRTVSVYAEVEEGEITSLEANRRLQAAFADVELRHPGVEVVYGGEFAETEEAIGNLWGAFPVSLLAIYMILAALFRSYLQPVVVAAAIPFGFVGVVLGVGLFQYKVSFILLYATIGLAGVVVNDSLVMVDFINRARAAGLPLLEAVRQSGVRRFRPILLTTLTTVVALLPMAFGLQGSSKTYGPFAASISFGLIVAMLGTLFAVPLAYTSLIVGQQRVVARLWPSREDPGTRSASSRAASPPPPERATKQTTS